MSVQQAYICDLCRKPDAPGRLLGLRWQVVRGGPPRMVVDPPGVAQAHVCRPCLVGLARLLESEEVRSFLAEDGDDEPP